MSSSLASALQYLECPTCGTRYVAGERHRDELLENKPTWFECFRCNKRVMSVAPSLPKHLGEGQSGP